MHIAESKNLTGLLMLVDFEKAFDLISWEFIYKHFSSLDTVVILFAGYNFSTQILNFMSSNVDTSQSLFLLEEDAGKGILFLHICS